MIATMPTHGFIPALTGQVRQLDFDGAYKVLESGPIPDLLVRPLASESLYLIEDLLQRKIAQSTPMTPADWEACWHERMLHQEPLLPTYSRWMPLRYQGQWVWPMHADVEKSWYAHLRQYFLHNWILPSGASTLCEFGCGSGLFLREVALVAPHLQRWALDVSSSALDLSLSGASCVIPFDGRMPSHPIPEGSVVVTMGMMEQLGTDFLPFAEYLLAQQPRLILHCEPIIEWYDDTPFDQQAVRYHRAKGYLEGFWPWVQAHGTILKAVRPRFGGWCHEGYNFLAWQPKEEKL